MPCAAPNAKLLYLLASAGADSNLHLRPVGIELVGQDGGDTRVRPLPELNVLADHRDGVVGRDADECVRHELACRLGGERAPRQRNVEADDEAKRSRALQELAPIGVDRNVHVQPSSRSSGVVDGGSDAMIGAAAADVASHSKVDVVIARLRNHAEQTHGRHDLPRLAVAALGHVERHPGGAHGVRLLAAGALDGRDLDAFQRADGRHTRAARLAIDVHRTGAALGDAAAELRACQALNVTQKP